MLSCSDFCFRISIAPVSSFGIGTPIRPAFSMMDSVSFAMNAITVASRINLKETDLVVVGNVHYPAQGGLGVLDDGIEPLAAVAHLHHALTAVAILEQLCLCLLEHLLGQHAGACAEVVNSCHNELSLSCIAQHRGFLWCVLLIAVAVVYRFCRDENKSIFAQRYGAKAPVRAQSTQMSLIKKQKQRQM